jgi:hypothetical protein
MRALVAAILFAGCISGVTSAAAASRHYFYANCFHESHGFIGYFGRRHADIAEAEKDCADHRKTYPGHRCTVKPVDY